MISHYRNYAPQQVHSVRVELSLFVPPTSANFSTSIALCVYLPQEGRFGNSQKLGVVEVGQAFAWKHAPKSCLFSAFWYLPLGLHESKDDTKLETLSSK
jgi:hypothetical protein